MGVPEGLLEQIDKLEPLPVTVRKLIPAASDVNVSLSQISSIIEKDQAIAANVFRTVNSALYAKAGTVSDLRQAIVRLGLDEILRIALCGHFKSRYTQQMSMYEMSENELLLHSVVASTAVEIMLRAKLPVRIPKIAPVAALLHDIGKLVMTRYMQLDFREIIKECERDKLTFVEVEVRKFGCDHAEVGAKLAEQWSFPEEICVAIRGHHSAPVHDDSRVLDAVVMGNYIAKTVGVGLGAEGLNISFDSECGRRLGLDMQSFSAVCAETTARLPDLVAFYK